MEKSSSSRLGTIKPLSGKLGIEGSWLRRLGVIKPLSGKLGIEGSWLRRLGVIKPLSGKLGVNESSTSILSNCVRFAPASLSRVVPKAVASSQFVLVESGPKTAEDTS